MAGAGGGATRSGGSGSLHPRRLCEWPQHAEPPWSRGAGHRGGVGQCGGPRVTRPACLAWVGCRGPRRPTAALSAQLVFGKAPAGVQDGGERVGSQALCTRSGPLHSRRGGGGHQCRGLLASRRPPPARDPAPAGRPPPALRCDQLRPRQLQKMAAKAAPVATLPRAGGAQQPCTLLPFPPRGLS